MSKKRDVEHLMKKIEELDEKIYKGEKEKLKPNKLNELRLEKTQYEDQLYEIAS